MARRNIGKKVRKVKKVNQMSKDMIVTTMNNLVANGMKTSLYYLHLDRRLACL